MKTFKTKQGTELQVMDLRGKDYLQVAERVRWFREERPTWGIETDFVLITEKNAVCKAVIKDEAGRIIAVSHKEESFQDFPAGFREKSETGAIGRALALVGYGTQFAPELDEGERVVDSPRSSGAPASSIMPRAQNSGTPNPRQASDSGILACLCGSPLKLSEKKGSYYCPNFKDSSREHSRAIPKAQYEQMSQQSSLLSGPPEEDVPFSFGDAP